MDHDGEVSMSAAPLLVELDPEGDVMLTIQAENGTDANTVRCCSRILKLASQVFSKMFGPDFSEGSRLREETCPIITLREDHPDAMLQLLSLLHYRDPSPPFNGSLQAIAVVAIQADKYDCPKALQFWAEAKCTPYIAEITPDATEIGSLLLAAYLFKLPSLKRILIEAVKNLTPEFAYYWEEDPIFEHLPVTLTRWLTEEISEALLDLQTNVYAVETRLRNYANSHDFNRNDAKVDCPSCQRQLPGSNKTCYYCGKSMHGKVCSRESRAVAYFTHLESNKLWPSVAVFKTLSPAEVVERITIMAESLPIHDCEAGKKCGLNVEKSWLKYRCETYLRNLSISAEELNSFSPSSQGPQCARAESGTQSSKEE